MRKFRALIVGMLLISQYSCDIFEKYKYEICREYVTSSNDQGIEYFNIGIYRQLDSRNCSECLSFEEIGRYCCVYKGKGEPRSKVSLLTSEEGYVWSSCLLNTSLADVDTLSISDKLKLIDSSSHRVSDSIPPELTEGYCYHFFGFKEMDGSYIVAVMEDGKWHVDYFGGGAW